jgi:pantetheine-phosphate adenylyltransferase
MLTANAVVNVKSRLIVKQPKFLTIAIPLAPAYNPCFFDLFSTEGPVKRIKAIYPGSFDPPTNGHLDLIERGSKIFDELVVAILRNPEKDPLFSVADRRKMLEAMTSDFDNVSIDTFEGLTVDYALRVEARAILRGIRAISDYEYELQMALMNRKLQPGLETVFMLPAEKYSYVSSRLVREVAQLGGSIACLVPDLVERKLREKMDVALKFEKGEAAEGPSKSRKKKA